ncbi:hypothetical protein GTO96_0015535, partial [Polypterus senegalus]
MAAAELFGCRFQVYRNGQIFYTFRNRQCLLNILDSQARVLYDFTAEPGNNELTVKEGETVTITNQEIGGGWLEAKSNKGEVGLVPEDYVEIIVSPAPTGSASVDLLGFDAFSTPSESNAFPSNQVDIVVSVAHSGAPENLIPPVAAPDQGNSTNDPWTTWNADASGQSADSWGLKPEKPEPPKVNPANNWKTTEYGHPQAYQGPGAADDDEWDDDWYDSKPSGASVDPESGDAGGINRGASSMKMALNKPVNHRYKHFDWLYERLLDKYGSAVPIPSLPDKQVTGEATLTDALTYAGKTYEEIAGLVAEQECIETCKLDLSLETPIFPGNGHLQPPPEDVQNYIMKHFRWNSLGRNTNGTLISTSQEGGTGSSGENTPLSILLEILSPPQRQAEMEPMEGQAAQKKDNKRSYSMEHFRWGKPVGRKRRPVKVYPNGVEEESAESYPAEIRRDLSVEFSYPQKLKAKTYVNVTPHPQNKNYTIDHFRWRDPPKDKRYGGFMKSWDERSQKPLLTLFKNVMIKDGHEKKGQ